MKVIVKSVGQAPVIKEINNPLDDFKSIVGGHLELFRPFLDDLSIGGYCNDEGKIMGMFPNIYLKHFDDIVVGDVVFFGVSNCEECSLNDYQISKLMSFLDMYSVS